MSNRQEIKLTPEQKVVRDRRLAEMCSRYVTLRRQRAKDERQQRSEKAELELKSVNDFRDYFKGLEKHVVPLVGVWNELKALVLNSIAGRKAAQDWVPSCRPLSVPYASEPEMQDLLQAWTEKQEANCRPGGVASNIKEQKRLEDDGYDKLANAKGDQLAQWGTEPDTMVLPDGGNSLAGHIRSDLARGVRTPYYCRLHFLDEDEAEHFALFGDNFSAKRNGKLVARLYRLSASELTGWNCDRQYDIAKRMTNFDQGNTNDDSSARVDEVMACHKKYLRQIEALCNIPFIRQEKKPLATRLSF